MRKWLILLSALSATAASGAPAWTWTDANGKVHFSDRPVPGARQVELTGAQGFGRPAPASGGLSRLPTPSVEAGGAAYQRIEVVSPAEQETLWNIGGTLTVQVSIQPSLSQGHRYDLAYDGRRLNLNTTSSAVTLPDVFRGQHTLQVVIIDSAGTELRRSGNRTFYVQQTSVRNPN
jgi:hypothetical protein